jgi:hypothetical protein
VIDFRKTNILNILLTPLKSTILFLLALATCVYAYGQKDCDLKLDKDSIRVYMCELPHSKYKSVKSLFQVHSSLSQLTAMVLDIDHLGEWQYKTASARVLKKISEHELIYYTEATSPIGINNRDFIIWLAIHQDPATRVLKIDALSMPDYLPAKPKVVRVPFSRAQWIVRPLNQSTLEVEYHIEIDLGGAIPPWLVNLVAYQAPYETFRDMRKLIGRYPKGKVGFIKD